MESTLHCDDVLLPRDASRHLQRGLNRLGARVHEKEGVEGGMGHDREQTFDEAQIRLMICDAALVFALKKRKDGAGVGGTLPGHARD